MAHDWRRLDCSCAMALWQALVNEGVVVHCNHERTVSARQQCTCKRKGAHVEGHDRKRCLRIRSHLSGVLHIGASMVDGLQRALRAYACAYCSLTCMRPCMRQAADATGFLCKSSRVWQASSPLAELCLHADSTWHAQNNTPTQVSALPSHSFANLQYLATDARKSAHQPPAHGRA